MHIKSEGQRFKTVGTFTPVRWDTAVFGANSMAETCLRRQYDFFFKHERTLSELAAAKVENVRLVEELVTWKRTCMELRAENFRMKHIEALPSAFGTMSVGSAFDKQGSDIFSGWLANQKVAEPAKPTESVLPTAEELAEHEKLDTKLMDELDEYLSKN